jgi:hypothetical protein
MTLQDFLTIVLSGFLDHSGRLRMPFGVRSGLWRDFAVFVSLSSADEFQLQGRLAPGTEAMSGNRHFGGLDKA